MLNERRKKKQDAKEGMLSVSSVWKAHLLSNWLVKTWMLMSEMLMNPKYIDTIQNQVCFLPLYVHGTYLFYLSIEDRTYSVDIEVIKARTHVPSETTQTREYFCDKLLERDIR